MPDALVFALEEPQDRRFMQAAIRYAMRHVGRTGTNPSVATLIVRDDGDGRWPRIVGRGVTALGGRPHAETVALAEAGELARGATAYVTLEPCAHHGRTPPCSEALVRAGVARVVSAAADPDPRVDGKGHRMLIEGGVAVTPGVLAAEAARTIDGYLTRHRRGRPGITMKMALSRDGKIGVRGGGQVKITGPVSNAQTHLVRARHGAIVVGAGTVLEDDPRLDCRLPGMADRSPARIILDPNLRISPQMTVAQTARAVPTMVAAFEDADPARRAELAAAGVAFVACVADPDSGRVALPELLEDLAATGFTSLLVEGGAEIAASFLSAGLVDRLILIEGAIEIGEAGVAAPVDIATARERYQLLRQDVFGGDRWFEFACEGA
ncbi:bifunctional diaminohydroxyphosphoribosylaminopyrimidine deaminase/5-amino-6-(5-phosphoribosylamino)uracil reductase RibD [Jiella sp. MQZ9-1]|uniref:Riboflavin biosynthesis protein RibD n=1 Tax=Jiella flava TaxID=2816857 RepID=A0A939JWN6_9HYPH|nr:bifunctional diaminohydroxyphosphoribosylaminopyrimidine deaminase/5-amino-6-(5-phosphoribosylamino)uracil reductase RibD [Jiella flava]MBO0663232.1 bifunctional diaminohydroxyphosphoribosylaminopyrimidine deaminase/5-amino-6-(5-phosphoribosylamino)uracil reductase RibD [Jiella flava]MCD2471808.1 bifunctional diaminohydroxyphosphoribosylaminopyrimidine deaminase/5-amino-6-(5-phosphoribosylamino)uracil reductase RibD [Jiella flava]